MRGRRGSNGLAWAAAALLIVGLSGLAGCGKGKGGPPVTPGAPVVLISVDTLRSDRLPFYGYGGVETPALSALRADSILYEKAYTHVPLTLPAHVSIFTGLLPDGHGVHDNLGYRVSPKVPTLAELLKKAGYATGGAVSSVVLSGASGVGRGFDLWDDDVVPTHAHQAISRVQRPGGEAEASLERWLADRKSGAPFFAFLHLYEPHAPYEPPEPFKSRYANPYDGEIAASDAIVGKFLDFLKAKGLYDGALIVFLSDHGEGLNEHGESEHGVFLYREVLQVPLLVKLPGGEGRGRSVASPVPLSDVFATIGKAVALPGFEAPAGTRSVLDAAWGPAAPLPERRIYAESFFARIHFGWSELRSLLDGKWHYVEAPKPEFYDLASDPGEKVNLIEGRPVPFRAMKIELEKLRTAFRPPDAVDPEAAKQLASLGYLSSGSTAGSGPLDDPKDHIATVGLMKEALADYKEGTSRKAVELTGRLLEENPRMMDIWELRSLALAKLGRMPESLEALKKAQELAPPGSTHYLRAIATQCLEMGQVDEALRHAQAAKALGDRAAAEILARALLARGDVAGAEAAAREFQAGPGNEGKGLLLLARIQVKRGDLPGALALSDRVATPDGKGLPPAGLHLLRGDILARMGRHAEAEAEFREEIRLFPETLTAWESLIALLAAEGKGAEVGSTVDALLRTVPGVEPYLSAIRVLTIVGDEPDTRRVRAEGIRRYPDDPRLGRTRPSIASSPPSRSR